MSGYKVGDTVRITSDTGSFAGAVGVITKAWVPRASNPANCTCYRIDFSPRVSGCKYVNAYDISLAPVYAGNRTIDETEADHYRALGI